MQPDKIRHYVLIPAKEISGRCRNKNWKNFVKGASLVDFTLDHIPSGIFEKVIVSTDKSSYRTPEGIEKHCRDKRLASKSSSVTEVLKIIIAKYRIPEDAYLWLLNPTSPFRAKGDYRAIADIVNSRRPSSVVSVTELNPFIWKDRKPLFATTGKRRNTEDFKIEYGTENGMFYVVKASYFMKTGSWYAKDTCLYRQKGIWSKIDIDTEYDFKQARLVAALWNSAKESEGMRCVLKT